MTNESVWKAQGKIRPGIEDSIAVGTAQIAKAPESKLVLKTTDPFYKALPVHYSPGNHISKSDPKNQGVICNSLDTARRLVPTVWSRAIPPSLLAHKPPYEWEMHEFFRNPFTRGLTTPYTLLSTPSSPSPTMTKIENRSTPASTNTSRHLSFEARSFLEDYDL